MQRPEKADPKSSRKTSVAKGHGRWLALIAIVLLAAFVLIDSRPGSSGPESSHQVRFTIPEGASRMVNQGKEVPGIPTQIRASVGDVLVIDNRDSATQFVAGYPISPHQKLKVPLNRAGTWSTNCSAHRDKSLEMVVEP